MKKWKIIAIGSTIILPLMLGLIFIVAISALLQVVISGTSNDGMELLLGRQQVLAIIMMRIKKF